MPLSEIKDSDIEAFASASDMPNENLLKLKNEVKALNGTLKRFNILVEMKSSMTLLSEGMAQINESLSRFEFNLKQFSFDHESKLAARWIYNHCKTVVNEYKETYFKEPEPLSFNESKLYLQQRLLENADTRTIFQEALIEIASEASKKGAYSNVYISQGEADINGSPTRGVTLVGTIEFLKVLCAHLRKAGIPTFVSMDDIGGGGLYTFQQKITTCKHVLLIGTENLLKKEKKKDNSVTGDLNLIRRKKLRAEELKREETGITTILISGTQDTSFPVDFNLYVSMKDWTQSGMYFLHLSELIASLYGIPSDQLQSIWDKFLNRIPPEVKSQITSLSSLTITQLEKKMEKDERTVRAGGDGTPVRDSSRPASSPTPYDVAAEKRETSVAAAAAFSGRNAPPARDEKIDALHADSFGVSPSSLSASQQSALLQQQVLQLQQLLLMPQIALQQGGRMQPPLMAPQQLMLQAQYFSQMALQSNAASIATMPASASAYAAPASAVLAPAGSSFRFYATPAEAKREENLFEKFKTKCLKTLIDYSEIELQNLIKEIEKSSDPIGAVNAIIKEEQQASSVGTLKRILRNCYSDENIAGLGIRVNDNDVCVLIDSAKRLQ